MQSATARYIKYRQKNCLSEIENTLATVMCKITSDKEYSGQEYASGARKIISVIWLE